MVTIEEILAGGGSILITCCQHASIHEKIGEIAPYRLEITPPIGWEPRDRGYYVGISLQRSGDFDLSARWPQISEMLDQALRPTP